MYKKELPRVSPEQMGVSSRMLLAMLQELEQRVEIHGFMLARHGCVIAEGWWEPYTCATAHICHSLGKSYVGTAVGLACTQGYLHLEDRIVDLFAEELAAFRVPITENLSRLTIEHQLMMANGMSIHAASGKNLLRNYLTTPVDHAPGERFLYNTTGSCMLGAAVMKVTGKPVRQYLTEEILNTIGVENDKLEWMAFHGNGVHAAPGVAASTENNLRLGLLYLNYGAWEGKQLIDRQWVERATTRRIRTEEINAESHTDRGAGYGYQLWICPEPETFKFAGGHGQDTVMCRRNDLVIATHAAATDLTGKASEEILSRYLLAPKLADTPLPEDPGAWEELKRYLATRRIPARRACSDAADLRQWSGIYRVVKGAFHINTELRPMDDTNVYTDFYDHDDVNVREMSLDVHEDCIDVVLDDGTIRTVLRAWLDGQLRPCESHGAIPAYRHTVSVAYGGSDGSLVIETKFLATCFWTYLTLTPAQEGCRVLVAKERLHESEPFFYEEAEMKRVL